MDAWVPTAVRIVAFVGDSITDGRGSDDNNHQPDLLLVRAHAQSSASLRALAFRNQVAGGNRILADGLEPNTIERFDCDVLTQLVCATSFSSRA